MPELTTTTGGYRSVLLESTMVARDRSISTLMDALRTAAPTAELVRALSAAETYTVVFREAAKGSLHQLPSGLYEAAVRDGSGRYVQRVLLKPSGAAVASAIAAVAVQLLLADISSRLDRLQVSIDRLRAEQKARQKGKVLGALRQLELIHRDAEPSRTTTLNTIRSILNAEFQTACANVRDQIAILPDPHDTSIFNIITSAPAETQKALLELRSEMSLALCCAEGLAQAEYHLHGGDGAASILARLVADLRNLPLHQVQDKARRIAIGKDEQPPDRFWIDLEFALETAAREVERTQSDDGPSASIRVSGSELLRLGGGPPEA